METKFTFSEEIAVASAICLRILELSHTISDCRILGQDYDDFIPALNNLKSAYRKVTGVEFNSVYHV